MAKIATVQLLLDVPSNSEAHDAVNEILREQQRIFTPGAELIDYAHGEIEDYPDFNYETYEEGLFVEQGAVSGFVYTAICCGDSDESGTWIGDIHMDQSHDDTQDWVSAACRAAREACAETWKCSPDDIAVITLFPGSHEAVF